MGVYLTIIDKRDRRCACLAQSGRLEFIGGPLSLWGVTGEDGETGLTRRSVDATIDPDEAAALWVGFVREVCGRADMGVSPIPAEKLAWACGRGRKPSAMKVRDSEARKRARGLKEIRLWVPDPACFGLADEEEVRALASRRCAERAPEAPHLNGGARA